MKKLLGLILDEHSNVQIQIEYIPIYRQGELLKMN